MAFGRLHRGQVAEWHDERGYGFIRDVASGTRLFFHATDVLAGHPRPSPGDEVLFGTGTGRDGRPSARQVRIGGSGRSAQPKGARRGLGAGSVARFVAAATLAAAVLEGSVSGRMPNWLPLAYFGMGVLSFALYWFDKTAARNDARRIPEAKLHTVDLFGGIVGGLVAQAMLRHKTVKVSFIAVTAVIVLLHAAVIGGVLAGFPLNL